jgi:hypothetical protein
MGFLGDDFVILQPKVGEDVKSELFLSFEIHLKFKIVFSLSQLQQLFTLGLVAHAIVVYLLRKEGSLFCLSN